MRVNDYRTKVTKVQDTVTELSENQRGHFQCELMELVAKHRRDAGCKDLECNGDGQVIAEAASFLTSVVANDVEFGLTVYLNKPVKGSDESTGKAIAMFRADNLMDLMGRVEEICANVMQQVAPQIIASEIIEAMKKRPEGDADDREGELH